jgi:hypothetical protein
VGQVKHFEIRGGKRLGEMSEKVVGEVDLL